MMKTTLLIFAGLLSISAQGYAQTSDNNNITSEKVETRLHEEEFISERSIDAERIGQTIERLKMSYQDLIDLKIDALTMKVTIVYRASINRDAYLQITNYFKK